MTPLERAARALIQAALHSDDPPALSIAETHTTFADRHWRDYLPQVRAVLTAIREPSERMQKAGADNGGFSDWYDGPGEREGEAVSVWQARIDAALAEGE